MTSDQDVERPNSKCDDITEGQEDQRVSIPQNGNLHLMSDLNSSITKTSLPK